jgi:hypothetical protein
MRKITQQSVSAFLSGMEFKSGNMKITVDDQHVRMLLHNNVIAVKYPLLGDRISISSAGWETTTTKERLNGLIEEVTSHSDKIQQKNFCWYWKDGEEFPSNEFVILRQGATYA